MSSNSKFIGFLIIGTKTQEEAVLGKGLMLWMQKKPTLFIRFCNKLLLGIRWVDKIDYDFAKIDAKFKEEEETTKVEMPKQRSYKKKTDGAVKERRNTKPSSTINKKQD
jgi:hypothetical protein